ncbi:molecular chaperone [Paraherbaspirillum soli]|uniref:Molecular chaperone n=1 Tax=Paraherbaspirillum soli TaxID=631222 RepID=A0ABW0MDN3_9BURK
MNTHRTRRLLAGCILSCCAIQSASAGVVVGATRVIFEEKQREASVPIKNADKSPFVVQAWVDTAAESDQKKAPFFVTPPLSRLDPGKENLLRIMRTRSNLPTDRESVFGMNIKEIPEASDKQNVLQIAIHTRIKLFYRPAGLEGNAAEAAQKLSWQLVPAEGGKGLALRVHNPTPFHVTFASVKLNGAAHEDLDLETAPPLTDVSYPVKSLKAIPAQPLSVSFQTINDYGATGNAAQAEVRSGAAAAKTD